MRKFEEIREFLSSQFSKEKKRLKSFGTKASSFDLANAVARHVQALMTESRNRELVRIRKRVGTLQIVPKSRAAKKLLHYIQERERATRLMVNAIKNVAEENEANRPWKPKPTIQERKKKKHKKHGHSRGTRSRRH